eukprot:6183709-Pleurochrysis_carterae.AAC.8
MEHTNVAEALAEICYRIGRRGGSPLEWSPKHLLEELDETRMIEAYIKYKLILNIEGTQTNGKSHEALSKKRWRRTQPRTPRLREEDELNTYERKINTRPITFHRALAEMGLAEWADIYDNKTKEYYTMGDLCKKYGVKKNARITQEYSNVKKLHRTQLQEVEQGALGIIWERHKGMLLDMEQVEQTNTQPNKVTGVIEKRKTAECWGGEYLIEWNDGDRGWVNKWDVQNMDKCTDYT